MIRIKNTPLQKLKKTKQICLEYVPKQQMPVLKLLVFINSRNYILGLNFFFVIIYSFYFN